MTPAGWRSLMGKMNIPVKVRRIQGGNVLATVKHAARRLRRWPAAMPDRRCAHCFAEFGRDEETTHHRRTKKHKAH
jgi:hypothetical protein